MPINKPHYLNNVEHFFVLMLENRSFDHLLGFSGISGTDAVTEKYREVDGLTGDETLKDRSGADHIVVRDNPFVLTRDLGHEFDDVKRQLCRNSSLPYTKENVTNSGFLLDRESSDPCVDDAIRCFMPEDIPVFNALAKEFVVCDRWFSPMPGPTFPNRMFAFAASSAGITASPSKTQFVKYHIPGYKVRFQNGHIFDRLRMKGIPWKVYAYDIAENMATVLDGMYVSDISDYRHFVTDIQSRRFDSKFTFIEPHYDSIWSDYSRGNSMHPLGDVRRGEQLVKEVYEAIRSSPLWPRSVLIITFDEHGGFYDHVRPPSGAEAPGDGHTPDRNFDFKQLGPRVPTIIISPLIEKNRIDQTEYDHTSIIKTLSVRFGLEPLTNRDRHAKSFEHLFTLPQARDVPKDLLRAGLGARAHSTELEMTALHAPQPSKLSASAETFVAASVALDATIQGPEAWPSIAIKAMELEDAPIERVMEYVEEVRRRARSKEAPDRLETESFTLDASQQAPADATNDDDGDGDGAAPGSTTAPSVQEVKEAILRRRGNLEAAAWDLKISVFEVVIILLHS